MNEKQEVLADDLLEKVSGGEFGKTEHTVEVNDANFGAFIHSALNVVVLFGVSWSNTCERACNEIEKLAEDNPRSVSVSLKLPTVNICGINWASRVFRRPSDTAAEAKYKG